MRLDGRKLDEKREIKITRNYTIYAEGCVLIEFGNTKVICTASVVDKVPPFLKNQGKGWITAEYSMLPRATDERNQREASKGKLGGRTMEIQRLIGRALRSCIDLKKLGERTITIDCDVIQADGGTRTASITGGFIALEIAMKRLLEKNILKENPIICNIAAISVGIVKGEPMLDLMYTEDFEAEVDMNVIMTDKGEFVEIQGTGEEATYSRKDLNLMLDLAEKGIYELIDIQRKEIEEEFPKKIPIFLATGNRKKINEISKILKNSNFQILSIKDGIEIPEVIEDGDTFEKNSIKKAIEISKFTNMITIADDSGLCVEALNGEPGVYSARYAGEKADDRMNNQKLIENLKGIENRKAKFVSVITLGMPDGKYFSFRGEVEGVIVDEPRGEYGFGYDPYFYLPEYEKTFAEMPEIKNRISHRSKALMALKNGIDDILSRG